jgi:antitoxin VapB
MITKYVCLISHNETNGGLMMDTVKIFESKQNQIVLLPAKYGFTVDEVVIQRLGTSLILTPKDKLTESFLDGINGFTEDYMSEGRYEKSIVRDSIE